MKKILFHSFLFLFSGTIMAQPNAVPIGNNPDVFSCSKKSRSNLWYDQDINSIVFLHKSDTNITHDARPFFYRYDLSTDGGSTWSINQGPVYSDTNDISGGFPLGLLTNPSSSIIPTDAKLAFAGSWENNNHSRSGSIYGIKHLNGSGVFPHSDSSSYAFIPENMFTVKSNGDIWMVGGMFSNDSAHAYMDSIIVAHGVYNTGLSDYIFSYSHLYIPVNPDIGKFADIDIAFDDFGVVGYIAMITNNDPNYLIYPDSIFYLSVLRSWDGGSTWSYANVGINRPDILDVNCGGINQFFSTPPNVRYGIFYDIDLVVDQTSNLHILTGVSPSRGFKVSGDDAPGTWGMFDIYTEDLGSTWKVKLLGKPLTYRSRFGSGTLTNPNIIEENRPFASRNWNGDVLFFSWFDTDTLLFGTDPNLPRHNNRYPDLHSIAYHLNTHLWTNVKNLTTGTNAEGQCTFGNGSYYVIDSAIAGATYSIPMVYQELQLSNPLLTGQTSTFWYLKNANINIADAIHPGNSVHLPDLCFIGIDDIVNTNDFSISPNYPDPFKHITAIVLRVETGTDVKLEVNNLLGEILISDNYPALSPGSHTLEISASHLSPGIYIYSVKTSGGIKSGKMVVQ